MSTCPSPETLGRLAHDASSATRFAAVDEHVKTCPVCQNVLERMAANSSASRLTEPERLPLPHQPPLIPGFVIERELGRGGMGVVYQAWQPRLARRVAIKVVGGGAGIGEAERTRWLDEARAVARLRHRNVVQIHQADEHEGCLYLVLDLIPGGSLAERTPGPLPARVAAVLMATMARTVHDLHQAGIVHLDLKPSNILLDGPSEGRWDQLTPMVTDFGISRTKDETGATDGVRGTPSYMAPEQVERSGVGPSADVYALGATLYCLLTGRPPFQAATSRETLALVQNSEPAPPGALVPGLSRDLETIALTCLKKDPQRRYASAGELADDLQRWLDGFPILARPVSKLEQTIRWCRRRPGFAVLLAVLALTVTSSLVGLFVLWRQSENALARAVESDKETSAVIREYLELLTETANAPQLYPSERLQKTSRVVHDLIVKLRRDQMVSASNVVAICDLARDLSRGLRGRGNNSESCALLTETLELLEEVKNRRYDPHVEEVYVNILFALGRIAFNEKHVDEALVFFRRAEKVLSGLVHDPRDLKAIVLIDDLRRTIAGCLDRVGQVETRRRLLESHVQMLDRLNQHPDADPTIGLLAVLTRLDLAPDAGACRKLRAAIRRFPADTRLPRQLEWMVTVWILNDIDPYPSGTGVPGKPMGRLEPDAHADAVIRAIESRCEAMGAGADVFPAVAVEVANAAFSRGAEQRKAKRLDDARRTTACLSAFAKTLARRHPDRAEYHIVMSEAFALEAKAGWQVEDYAVIETAWRKALGEAGAALRLDPMNVGARVAVASLQEKLIKLAAREPERR